MSAILLLYISRRSKGFRAPATQVLMIEEVWISQDAEDKDGDCEIAENFNY